MIYYTTHYLEKQSHYFLPNTRYDNIVLTKLIAEILECGIICKNKSNGANKHKWSDTQTGFTQARSLVKFI